LIKIFLFLITTVFAYGYETLSIDSSFKESSAKEFIYFIEDTNLDLSPLEVLNSTTLTLPKKAHIGVVKNPVWTRLSVKNSSNKIQNLFFSNQLSGTNYIDVYIYKDGVVVQEHTLGDMRAQKSREIISSLSTFNLLLLKDESLTIVTRLDNYQVYNIDWNIQSANVFMRSESNKLLIMGIFAGLTLLIIAYNIFLFKIYNNIGYMLLALQSLIFIIYQYGFHGLLYRFDLGIDLRLITTIPWTIPHLGIFILILFQYQLFDFKNRYPKLALFSKIIATVSIVEIILFLSANLINAELFAFAYLTALVTSGIILFLFITGVYMYLKKETGATYYLFGQGILLGAILLNIFGIYKIMPYPETAKYVMPIASILDSFFLLIAQYLNTEKKQKKLLQSQQLLIQNSKSLLIGQTLENIAHQWKHPLTKLGSSITLLESISKHDSKRLLVVFNDNLPSLRFSIELMKKILDEFLFFNKTITKDKEFSLYKIIEKTISILQSKITLFNVTCNINIDENIKLKRHDYIISNIAMVLIDNAIEEFDSKSKGNTIEISVVKSDKAYTMYFKDNAGGIKQNPIELIFQHYESRKKEKQGKGIGLFIAKTLIENELKGTISAQNIDNGAMFKVELPI
jgi:two-component system, sensor histidine kinase LadS